MRGKISQPARRLSALICMLFVWLLATPARAAAPQCDTRGATTFAPAPTLQAPSTSIDIGDAAPECGDSWLADALDQRSSSPDAGQELAQTVLAGGPMNLHAPSTRTDCAEPPQGRPLTGVRFSLERPPR